MLTIYSWFDFIPISTLLVADNKEEDTKSVSFFNCDLGWFFVVFPAVFYSVSAPTGPMFFSIWICFCSNIVPVSPPDVSYIENPHHVSLIWLRFFWSQIATCSVCDSLSLTLLQMRELYGFLHDTTHLSYHIIADKCYLPSKNRTAVKTEYRSEELLLPLFESHIQSAPANLPTLLPK